MADGFKVTVADLQGYADQLAADTQIASDVSGKVGQADVGDESWGIVGLFVKGKYTEMLGDLQSLLDEMGKGLQSGSEKVAETAETYQAFDEAVAEAFEEIQQVLGTVPTNVGPGGN